jgi:hypothetical protein
MKKLTPVIVALGVAFALAGCGGTPVASSSTADPAATSSPSAETADEPDVPSDEPAAEETTDADAPVSFGQTYKWEDGLEVTVTAPKKYTPSEYASADGEGTHMRFQVTIKNTGTKPYDPSLFTTTVSSGEAESSEIFDSGKGLEGSPSTKVRPGKTVKFPIGYTVLKPKDITMEVSPGFDYNEAIFTNNP